METTDRAVLEQQILIAFAADPTVTSVLFVGCDWYTAHYERLLGGTTVFTIDPDPRRRRFGAARHHVAPFDQVDALFQSESLDAIVCNGVYGWGLDSADECERAFRACAGRLKPGGWFVFGWNNVPARDPAPTARRALPGFVPALFEPLGTRCLEIPDSFERHTFAFYRRAGSADQVAAEFSGDR